MANMYINAMTDLWNSAGTTYSAIKMNVTSAASHAASKLMQLQISGTDKFSVDKTGNVVAVGSVASAGHTSSAALLPSANDIAALGSGTLQWSDLYLASGGLIDFANNDWRATHATGVLNVTTGDLRVTTAGTNAASAVTVGGTQTLTGKTLTSPTITGGTINNTTIGVTTPATGIFTTFSTTASTTLSPANANVSIAPTGTGSVSIFPATTAGTINNMAIGASTPLAGTFTTLSANTITANTNAVPDADAGAGLGTASLGWTSLYLALNGAVRWPDANITHATGGVLTVNPGDLRIAVAGTSSQSVVTLSGTQTLTNKTLTSPTINAATMSGTIAGGTYTGTTLTSPTINAATMTGSITGGTLTGTTLTSPTINGATMTGSITGGTFTGGTYSGTITATGSSFTNATFAGTTNTAVGATWTNLGTVTTIDINGGTIDGTVIGGAAAAAATVTTLQVNTSASPDTDDGAALGTGLLGWSDLFLASGGVINWANSNATITHSTGNLIVAGGDFRVNTTGSQPTSVVTVGGTQTLSNKSFVTANITTTDIDGGTIDGTTIGGTSPSTGVFTTLQATGSTTFTPLNANVTISPSGTGTVFISPAALGAINNTTIGGTTPTFGTFTTLQVNTNANPDADDGAGLGTGLLGWSDLFLASGATIMFANGNSTLAHSTGFLAVSNGDFRVISAGTNTASAVTVGGTQTLTNKTLTSPTINGTPTAAAATWANLGAVTTIDINGGTIDNTNIGVTTPVLGYFTTLTVNNALDLSAAAAGQIVFPATQNASSNANTLDDYEESTFTPIFAFVGGSVGLAYTSTGHYTKIGNIVLFTMSIILTAKGTSTGSPNITGMPFNQKSGTASSAFSVALANNLTGLTGSMTAYLTAGANVVFFQQWTPATGTTTVSDANFTNTTTLVISGQYPT